MKDRQSNVLSLLEDKTNNYARKIALGIKTGFGWNELTFDGLGLLSRRLASYLINDLGIQKGEKLAILSESKPEFGVCVFASVLAGTITVPLDIKLTKYELTSILSDCLPSVMLVSQNYIEKAKELQAAIPSIKHIIVMDERPVSDDGLQSIYTLPMNYTCKWRHRARKSRMFIIYTSGTTGAPKGVETTFGNILAQLKDLKIMFEPVFPKKGNVRILSILPMNHLFEMTVGFATFLNFGYSVYYTQSLKPKDCLNMIKDKKIQFMILVPAFLRLLKTTLESEIKKAPKFYQQTFPLRYHIAKFLPYRWIKKLMFKRLHDCFGGSFKACLSGGAPYDFEVAKFFRRIGIEVYEGYGLTETSPVATLNVEKNRDLRSVGKLLPSYEGKIDPDTGELLLKGPSIMRGYHHQPELTAEAIDEDGFFHTGDMARIDDQRRVYITGRIKNMIVLSGGKKVFPEEVESVMEKSDKFAEYCVFGVSREGGAKDGTEDIAIVVVPKDELKEQYSKEELEKVMKEEVKRLSKQLAPYKRPINVTVLYQALPRTTTRKIQRKKVKELVGA
ncbi:MAG: AMP-binding protein [Muribaculaceae bacterium]|nr:AMP-binding protein [Muribaculaceae bacterium]